MYIPLIIRRFIETFSLVSYNYLCESYLNGVLFLKRIIGKALINIILITMILGMVTCASSAVSTTVILRVSKITQSAVVNVGEDLSMEVALDGCEPDTYQWYYQDAPIANANQKVYNIVDAELTDSGIYRMEAFDANGKMLVSMDINARVIDPNIPKSGDDSFPIEVAVGVLLMSCAVLFLVNRRRAVR